MPNTKKKQQTQPLQTNDNQQNGHHSVSSSNNNSASSTKSTTPSKKLKAEMQQEQYRLYRELDDYITQFRTKALKKTLSQRELIILFVMNLNVRWKRLVEPEEYRFKDWEEAAQVARYHAIKISALMGAERCDQDPMFTSKEAKEVLQSGYFKSDLLVPKDIEEKNIASTTTKSENDAPQQQEKKIPADSQDEKTKTTEQSSTKTTTTPSTSDKNKLEKEKEEKKEDEDDGLTHTQRRGKLVIPAGANKKSVCYKIPSAHKNVNLPFVDLIIDGVRVRHCLLAKKRWGASAMSVALQEDLKLTLNRSEACDIGTEFGQVKDALGSVNCMIQHPCNASLVSELAVQVMPALYGGEVDLILGADFFFFFGATFNLKCSMVRFMGQDCPFYPDKFE